MKFEKVDLITSPLRLLRNLEDTVYELVETFTWGKAAKQSIVTLDDMKHWFKDLPTGVKKKIYFGVVARIQEVDSGRIRLFQGVFDKKEKCMIARQIVAGAIAEDLETEFGATDLIIFSTSSEFISKYQAQ